MEQKKKKLAANTFYLYLLTFTNYFFSFITVPYQTRVLGPEVFGIIGFALAFYTYFLLIIDYGFVLSATKTVAENSKDKYEIGKILSNVTIQKTILAIICLLILFVTSFFVNLIKENIVIIILYLLLAYLTNLTPDFIYRGLENMKILSIRAVVIRMIFTLLIFVFLKRPSQYLLVPIFQIIGVTVSLIWIYYDLIVKQRIHFAKSKFLEFKTTFLNSSNYFLSRIASTIYGATNTVIIGFLYPSSLILGYYTSAEKFKSLASQAASPIADSLYPYMIRTNDYRTLLRILIYIEIMVIVGCIILGLYASNICAILFGEEYASAGIFLQLFLPCIAIILPNYVMGFPALTPIGKQKWANFSVEIAMLNQLIGFGVLYFVGYLNAYSICCLTVLSDFICFFVRLYVFISSYRNA